ncbi:ParA family protein [Paraurantiacibacter namhicola]|uniref:Chromosome partitioning protein ParA n=1 Tax=Paraurantiacibacter namhicola TaxID=645517 RepID=A0A1C7D6L9_9SPHN|nr:ParA family protein [Paraurantiacibacter namhicola]ANU07136.1 Chromosome partitioning protein ParA [Paraurantiacibacter namhicola]
MAVIAIFSAKGGVGKTTIALDMAWQAAVSGGKRTLLWDLDPQGGASWMLQAEPPSHRGAISVFQRDGKPRDHIVSTGTVGLDCLCADDSLRNLPLQLARIGNRRRLATLCNSLRGTYDRVVLDCPPGLNEISEQIMAAADLLIVPIAASPLSSRTFAQLRKDLTRHPGHPPTLPVLTMFDVRRRMHMAAHEGFAAGWPTLPSDAAAERAASVQQAISEFAPRSRAAQALSQLYDKTERKLRTMKPKVR